MPSHILALSGTLLVLSLALAAPMERAWTKRDFTVASTTPYGNLDMQGLNRDSCSSTAWSIGSVLWNCRDTQQILPDGSLEPMSIANTASYSPVPSRSNPGILTLSSPQAYGSLFYPLESDECDQFGMCSDGSRWVGWPDTAPAVVFQGPNGEVNAYAFIAKQHLSGLTVINADNFTYSLYHVLSMNNDTSSMPSVSLDVSNFWGPNEIGYGSAGSVMHDNHAYLYGATPNGKLSVARSSMGFLGSLNDKATYEYYANGQWSTSAPDRNDPAAALPNTRAVPAQGTVYYSPRWSSFVWIGGDGFPNANFYLSTAPAPEGPWSEPALFYSGEVGDNESLPAYSTVAHPGMTDGTGDYIFLSWTKQMKDAYYEQPLVRVDWA